MGVGEDRDGEEEEEGSEGGESVPWILVAEYRRRSENKMKSRMLAWILASLEEGWGFLVVGAIRVFSSGYMAGLRYAE